MASHRPPGTTALDFIELTQLPYLTACPLHGRRIPLLTHHDGTRFSAFVEQPDGTFMVVNPLDLAGGHYLGKAPAYEEDVPVNLYAVVIQHYSFPKVLDVVQRMHADIVNAMASIHRYFVMLSYANRYADHVATTQMVGTELEYAFGNYRAFFDLLNRTVGFFRFEPQYSACALPDSFRKTLQKTDDELVSTFGVPPPLLEVLRANHDSFFLMRAIRDAIFHGGANMTDVILHLEDGFAVSSESGLFTKLRELKIWPADQIRANGLASLLPLLAFMLKGLTMAAESAAMAIIHAALAPDPIASDHGVFFRSSLTRHLRNLKLYETEHWLRPEQVLELRERSSWPAPNSPQKPTSR